jgi:hypothetical protein
VYIEEEKSMPDPVVDALILGLLEWLAAPDRSYQEAMDAWRTSCPKLPVWEEANDRGLVEREEASGRSVVRINSSGRALVERRRSAQGKSSDATMRSIGSSRCTTKLKHKAGASARLDLFSK